MEISDNNPNSIDSDEATTRGKILEAACLEFIERGYDGARVQHIAELSGANKAMIYYYFGSKRRLYRLVFKKMVLRNLKKIKEITYRDEPLEDKIRSLISFYLELFGSDPGFLRLVMRELAGDSAILTEVFGEVRKEAEGIDFPGAIFEKIFRKGVETSELRRMDQRHTMASLVGMSAGYFILRPVADTILGLSEKESEEFAASRVGHVIDLLFHGILERKKEEKN